MASVNPAEYPEPSLFFSTMYEPLELIGSGGFGFVLRCARRVDGLIVAVKLVVKQRMARGGLIRCMWEEDAVGLEQWQDGTFVVPLEAYVLRKAHHSSVVQFVDLFADETYFYLVMEHHGSPWKKADPTSAPVEQCPTPPLTPPTEKFPLPLDAAFAAATALNQAAAIRPSFRRTPSRQSLGLTSINGPPSPTQPVSIPMVRRSSSSDLFECIEQHNCFSEHTARFIFSQVVRTVADLRKRGIVHRDIKDENVTCDSNGIVKLIDFGSAVLFDPSQPLPLFDRFYGTTSCAPAEVLQGRPFGLFEAEVWSLGVLLHILLTGQAPFANREAAKRGERTNMSQRVRLSSAAHDLLDWCFVVNPADRVTLEEMLDHQWMRASTTA
ncbi:hypothetical protein OIO90_001431 [Microbotryomycetes sp. JL221]|nr:hypothetical protein OIO90_001431 [Microbotryomycetes sp. JL221]